MNPVNGGIYPILQVVTNTELSFAALPVYWVLCSRLAPRDAGAELFIARVSWVIITN